MLLGDGGAEKAHLPHLAEDLRLDPFLAIGVDDARLELFLRELARAGGDHPLLFRQLVVETQRIGPVETAEIGRVLGAEGLCGRVHGRILMLVDMKCKPTARPGRRPPVRVPRDQPSA